MAKAIFKNAGRKNGLEIWQIENFQPVPLAIHDYGKFYSGDSYIVLKTSGTNSSLSWNLHFWLGAETTQDEAGSAAILAVHLDDEVLDGAAVQHRETQDHESPLFQSYFQPAIRYMDGGHASGFSHVTTNAGAEKRLFQIKGKRNVRVRQVDPLISSMNKGDCFILDVDQSIFVYVGERAKNVEKLKAISVANQVRDQDHNGRGIVTILDQYSNTEDLDEFFTALGSGSKYDVPADEMGGDDEAFERDREEAANLYEVSDVSGDLKVTELHKPYRKEHLNPMECYILDTASTGLYVWVGKQSTLKEKAAAMNIAQKYLLARNYPSWVNVTKLPQGTEVTAFKNHFQNWNDVK